VPVVHEADSARPICTAVGGGNSHGDGIWALRNPDDRTKPKFGTAPPYQADDCGGADVNAGSFVVGRRYGIKDDGTSTAWESLGARASSVGTSFTATGVGGGDGVATVRECPLQTVVTPDVDTLKSCGVDLVWPLHSCDYIVNTWEGGGTCRSDHAYYSFKHNTNHGMKTTSELCCASCHPGLVFNGLLVQPGVPDGVITDEEKAPYLLYEVCSCYHVRARNPHYCSVAPHL
jgi:hypothetical protein